MTGVGHLVVLIIGGYGTFGGRLVRLLVDEPHLTLIVSGRSAEKAARFCSTLTSQATLNPVSFDRDGDISSQLEVLRPDLVIDAAGPFQAMGREPYRLVKSCLDLGVSYFDLADASTFVREIDRFDQEARSKSLVVLSGLSTFPALTFAVLRHLAEGLVRIDQITMGVAPSPHAGVGLNVIRGLASYAGRPVPLLRGGSLSAAYGLAESRRLTIAPPGQVPLGSRIFSLVDVPDLTLAGRSFPELDSVWVGAGTHPALLHRGLGALSWLVRLGLLPGIGPLAGIFHRVKSVLRWGEDRGGLIVAVEGETESGVKVSRSWHLIAEGDAGPFIPTLPAVAVVKSMLDGNFPPSGARPATETVRLSDLVPLFASLRITSGMRQEDAATAVLPLYQRILGESWSALPPSLRALHGMTGSRHFAGQATVERGQGWLATMLAAIIGFPAAGDHVAVSVHFETREGAEIWHRDFAGRKFSSRQSEGRGRGRHLVAERFGPVVVGLALLVERGRLRLVVRRWSLFGVPMPIIFAPGGDTYETEVDGCFAFHVEISTPLSGLVVRYRGRLLPVAA